MKSISPVTHLRRALVATLVPLALLSIAWDESVPMSLTGCGGCNPSFSYDSGITATIGSPIKQLCPSYNDIALTTVAYKSGSPRLPLGLDLDPSTGCISGTAEGPEETVTVILQPSDSSLSAMIPVVVQAPPRFSPNGLFLQLENSRPELLLQDDIDKYVTKLNAMLKKACDSNTKYRDTEYFIHQLVIQFAAEYWGNENDKEINNDRIFYYTLGMDVAKNYFHCFSNVFVGTALVSWTGQNGNPGLHNNTYYDGICDEHYRWLNIDLNKRIAEYLSNVYLKDITFHWYIPYEANLNYFITNKEGTMNRCSNNQYTVNDAFKAFLSEMVNNMTTIKNTTILWSPSFWDKYDPNITPELKESLKTIFSTIPKLNWLHFQDLLGATSCLKAGVLFHEMTMYDVKGYYRLLQEVFSPPNVSLAVNMEMFTTQPTLEDCTDCKYVYSDTSTPGINYCKYVDIGIDDLHQRQVEMKKEGIPVGTCFEIRYWYEALLKEEARSQ